MGESDALPKNFVLKSLYNNSYLRFIDELNDLHGFLQFSGKKVFSPYSKFTIEYAKSHKDLVHVRCCYNNKYWVLSSPSSHHIVASSKELEEDQSKFSCTLFKPYYDSDRKAFGFQHVFLGRAVHLDWLSEGLFQSCLVARTSGTGRDLSELSTVVNWDSLFIIPKYVAFKGDNGRYLQPTHYDGNTYLQFSANDIGDSGVMNEVVTTDDGHMCIKNVGQDKFWVHDPDWIHVKETRESSLNNPHALFWPIRLDNDNGVALRNMGNNNFCKRLTLDGKENCLNAQTNYISDEVRMEVTNVVFSRDIYNVRFRLSDSRIYNQKPINLASGVVENNNSVPTKLSVKMSYENTVTSVWSSSISVTFGRTITLSSGIGKIAEGEVELSTEFSNEYSWGKTVQTKTIVEVSHDIVTPAWTKVKGSILATQGTCDIPFSYTQRDTLSDGRVITARYDDGVYTGVNSYNFKFIAEEI